MREVADEADADTVVVEEVVGGLAMGPMLLLVPARTNFDETVRRIRAVANHKMVSELVPPVAVSMMAIERSGTAFGGGAMVNDDRLPARVDAPSDGIPCLGRGTARGPGRLRPPGLRFAKYRWAAVNDFRWKGIGLKSIVIGAARNQPSK